MAAYGPDDLGVVYPQSIVNIGRSRLAVIDFFYPLSRLNVYYIRLFDHLQLYFAL